MMPDAGKKMLRGGARAGGRSFSGDGREREERGRAEEKILGEALGQHQISPQIQNQRAVQLQIFRVESEAWGGGAHSVTQSGLP